MSWPWGVSWLRWHFVQFWTVNKSLCAIFCLCVGSLLSMSTSADSQVVVLRCNVQMNVGDMSTFLALWESGLKIDFVSQLGAREGHHFLATNEGQIGTPIVGRAELGCFHAMYAGGGLNCCE